MQLLGPKLKQLRREKKLTQIEVAEAIGVSRPFLTAIENGREYPGRETLMATANFFNVTLDWLTEDQNKEMPARALNDQEALLLYAYRNMEPTKAELFLKLMLDASDKKK
ncbi:HTH-type transcriptional regulator Xre [Commensalibacter sp. Nvir]|uniref:helix-turn-helix domain-containing protein n=1 Tax=Commensalibacter sp. Nvir TaxID=3069817 RepID=UPI002D449399|nr:HTH-type transcriptional regulator Xre [Commensalibacter sp. Nvir]